MKQPPPPAPRRRRALRALAVIFVLYAITGFFILPPIVRQQATTRLSTALKRPVSIEKVSINPLVLSITVRGFNVVDHGGPELTGFDELYANFQLSSLLRRTWYFREVRLERPRGRLAVGTDGALNIADLVPGPEAAPTEPADPPSFLIENLAITGGVLDLSDRSRSVPFETVVGPVNFALASFGTGSGKPGSINFRGSTDSEERFSFEGLLNVVEPGLSGRLTVTGLHAPKYDPFHHDMTRFALFSGRISFNVDFVVSMQGGLIWSVDPCDAVIEDLAIRARDGGEDVVSVPVLRIEGIRADSTHRAVTIARVAAEPYPADAIPGWSWNASKPAGTDPGVTTIRLARLPSGELDLATLFAVASSETEAAPSGASARGPRWSVVITEAGAKEARIEFTDLSMERPVKLLLDRFTMVAHNVSTFPEAEIGFESSVRWQEEGLVKVSGRVIQRPLIAHIELEATNLALASLDSYLAPWIDVRVTDGAARAAGSLDASVENGKEPVVSFTGTAGVDRLAVLAASGDQPIVSLGALDIRGISFNSPPAWLDIDEIIMDSPGVQVEVAEDGSVNLLAAMKSSGEPAPEATPVVAVKTPGGTEEPPGPKITIGRVTLNDGRADVVDRSVEPTFTSSLRDFSGTISGLSSEEVARADVDLKGNLNGAAPLHVSGQINPLSEDAFTDLHVDFRGIELPSFTPYSGRHVGYAIDKGKLTLDLNYRLSSRTLEAENSLVLDEFYLGNTVESPDAMKLPLKLALALLRDRSGKIDINLPIRGNLDDPDFRYGSVVWKAFGNLIAKAATAPFSLLGALIPGDNPEELSYIAFAPGSAELDATANEKLTTLADALYNRPALKLEIVSKPQPATDGQSLRAERLESILVERYLESNAGRRRQAADQESIVLDDVQRAGLIRAEFARAFPAEAKTAAVAKADTANRVVTVPRKPPEVARPEPVEEEPGFVKRSYRRALRLLDKVVPGNIYEEEKPRASEHAPEPTPPPEPVVATREPTPAAPSETEEATPDLAEMESRLLERIEIPAGDLQALASNRATAIRDRLTADGRVEVERISIAPPAEDATEDAEATESRVEFKLQ
jgi:hypothetical protein